MTSLLPKGLFFRNSMVFWFVISVREKSEADLIFLLCKLAVFPIGILRDSFFIHDIQNVHPD